jgi:hypothetical protein
MHSLKLVQQQNKISQETSIGTLLLGGHLVNNFFSEFLEERKEETMKLQHLPPEPMKKPHSHLEFPW